ncbi:MAG TPA: hypothetical protein VFZ16_15505 [Hyphomicrobiaceae bacterium]|nr:hypothetical protein [Hyphomicrobiaceae bacterium]
MPLQNRVTPEGEIIATPHRGLMMGNRGGAIHRPDRTLGARRWTSRQWICCVLQFKGRQRRVMAPGTYTELFFLDEATALAAGHRPCFECRRADALRFAELWGQAHGSRHDGLQVRARAPVMDAILHAERVDKTGRKRTYQARLADLPTGTFIHDAAKQAYMVGEAGLLAWQPSGYSALVPASTLGQDVEVLTPPSIVAVLSAGYRPMLHASAAALLG